MKSSILTNHSGGSLYGLMLSLAIDSILALAVVGILAANVQGLMRTKSTVETEVQSSQVALLLQETIGSAINVDVQKSPVSVGNIGASTRGLIASYTSTLKAHEPTSKVVAAFLYEVGRPSSTEVAGQLGSAAIFMQDPSPRTPGVLSISIAVAKPGQIVELSDLDRTEHFANIVEFQIEPTGFMTAEDRQPARSIRVRLVTRKFITGDDVDKRWCPALEMSRVECKTKATFNDVERVIRIGLRNNLLPEDSGRSPETVYGSLYFFKPVSLKGGE